MRQDSLIQRSITLIDWHVGCRVCERQAELGMSLEELSDQTGIDLDCLQGIYEGTQPVFADMLIALCTALDVPLFYFFDDMPADLADEMDNFLMARQYRH